MNAADKQERNTSVSKGKKSLGKTILRIFIRTMIVICVLGLSGCAVGALWYRRALTRGGYMESWDNDEGRILAGLSYGEGGARRYDLYLHNGIDPDSETPLLLLVHGGSWMAGNRSDMAYACKYYGRKGCITATMDYSLVSEDKPEITVATMLDDITACIAAIKKKMEKEGYHVSGLAVGGVSAGGHLALLYAYSRAADSAIPIAFVFEKVGPVSFHKEFWDDNIAAVLIGYGAGIPVDPEHLDDPETLKAADSLSPLHFVGPDIPPTIFAYGGKDDLVRPIHRDELAKALEEHHVPNICVDFPNSNHAMWDDTDSVTEFRDAVLQFCQKYMKLSSVQ